MRDRGCRVFCAGWSAARLDMQPRGLDPLFLFVLVYSLPTRLSKHSMHGVVVGILGAVANRCLNLDSSLRASFRFFPPCFLRRILSLLFLDFSFSLSLPLGRSLPVNSTSVGTILTCLDSSPQYFLGFIPPNVSRIVFSLFPSPLVVPIRLQLE